MARTVPPWLWAVCLRDHGPRDPLMLLVLHTLRTYMDESGFCYPSQEQIAEAAAVSVRTVRNKLPEASRMQWIGMATHAKAGQKWKSYSYRACIPDHVELGHEKYEQIADTWASQHGEVYDEELAGGLSKPKAPAPRAGSSVSSPGSTGKPGTKHRHATTEVPANGDEKHRHHVPTNSDILTSSSSALREGAALPRNTALSGESQKGKEASSSKPHLQTSASSPEVVRERIVKATAKRPANGWTYSDDELKGKVAKLFLAGIPPSAIVKSLCQYAHHDRIWRTLNRNHDVPWVSSP